MTTHRSLNKLEFKAHMSIHNIKEVEERESHESGGTRDRFGKNHLLSDEEGRSRIARRKRKLTAAAAAVLLGPLFYGHCTAQPEAPKTPHRPSAVRAGSNTNIQVETSGLDANSWLNQKFNEPEEKFGIAVDENTSVGINDNGDPNMAMTF